MPTKKSKRVKPEVQDVLQDILIVQLCQSGIPQQDIRKIVGVDMARVGRIAKHFKSKKKKS